MYLLPYENLATTTRKGGEAFLYLKPWDMPGLAPDNRLDSFNRCHDIVVKPKVLKSSSKDRAGMFLSSPEMTTRERASTKKIFLSLPKRLNKAMA
jgi:hypothetical protein